MKTNQHLLTPCQTNYAIQPITQSEAMKQIDRLTRNAPCMSVEAQKQFRNNPEAEAYRVELAKMLIAIRELAATKG
jgi:hypothetical protein